MMWAVGRCLIGSEQGIPVNFYLVGQSDSSILYHRHNRSTTVKKWFEKIWLPPNYKVGIHTDKNCEKIMRKIQKIVPIFSKWEYLGQLSVFFFKFSHDFCQCKRQVQDLSDYQWQEAFSNHIHILVLLFPIPCQRHYAFSYFSWGIP